MSDSLVERVHPASPQRRQQARAEGRVARSHELTTALVLLGSLAAVWYFGGDLVGALAEFAQQQWGAPAALAVNEAQVVSHWQQTTIGFGRVVLPLLGLMLLVALAGNLGQIGFLFLPGKAAPDWNRISPARGLQRMFSGDNAIRLGLTLARVAVVLTVAGASLWGDRERLLAIGTMNLGAIVATFAEVTLSTCLKIAGAMLALGVLDYLYQRWRFEQSLQMTDHEMREEVRAREGDPTLPGRRRALRQRIALDRVAKLTAEAHLVIRSGSRLAVAARYDAATMAAPVVWIKGTGDSAETICRTAKEHEIVVADQPELARRLSRDVPIQSPIPPDLYKSVAALMTKQRS